MRKLAILSVLLIFVLAIGVNAAADFVVEMNVPAGGVNQGQAVTITVNVENTGDDAEDIKIKFTENSDLFEDLETDTFDLDSGEERLLSFEIASTLIEADNYELEIALYGENDILLFDADGNSFIETSVLTVNPTRAFTVKSDKTSVTTEDGKLQKTITLTVENTGNVDLQNAQVVFKGNSLIEDNVFVQGDKRIRVTYPDNDAAFSLDIGNQLKTIKVNVDADSGIKVGDYKGEFRINAPGLFTQRVVPFTVTIGENLCDAGISVAPTPHNLEIRIDEPDDGDEIKPGDIIKLKIDVENNNNDDVRVKVEASLVNLNSGKKIGTIASDDKKVKDGEEETFELELTVDADEIDDGDDLRIFVKAYQNGDEATKCNEASTNLDAVKDDSDVRITSFKLLPQSLMCGQTGEGIIEVKNFGAEDQDVRVKLLNSALGIDKESNQFELEEGKDDSDATVRLRIDVPKDQKAQEYEFEARVLYSGNDASSFTNLIVTCVPEETVEDNTKVTSVSSTEIPSITARAVQNAPVVTNTNEVPKNFFDSFKSTRETPIALWVLADLILVLIIVFIIALVVKRR